MNGLSIIIQGPVGTLYWPLDKLLSGLSEMRKKFPLAEIIFSTWDNDNGLDDEFSSCVKQLNVRLVLSPDPGPVVSYDKGIKYLTNVNRLLVSTAAGLAASTQPLSVKLRSDCFLSSRIITTVLERYMSSECFLARNRRYQIFSQRMITASWIARDARGSLPFLFHPGDIFLAGNTCDLKLYFSAPLADERLFRPATSRGLWCAWKYVPEQWLWINAIKKVQNVLVFEGNFQGTEEIVRRSEQYLLANFICLDPDQLALHWPKFRKKYARRGFFSLYTHRRWLSLYERYHGENSKSKHMRYVDVMVKLWRAGYFVRAILLRLTVMRRIAQRYFIRK